MYTEISCANSLSVSLSLFLSLSLISFSGSFSSRYNLNLTIIRKHKPHVSRVTACVSKHNESSNGVRETCCMYATGNRHRCASLPPPRRVETCARSRTWALVKSYRCNPRKWIRSPITRSRCAARHRSGRARLSFLIVTFWGGDRSHHSAPCYLLMDTRYIVMMFWDGFRVSSVIERWYHAGNARTRTEKIEILLALNSSFLSLQQVGDTLRT